MFGLLARLHPLQPLDSGNFLGAVIDDRAFGRLDAVFVAPRADDQVEVLTGGTTEDGEGSFMRPTLLAGADPEHDVFSTEFFGPLLAPYVYDDGDYNTVVRQLEGVARYALTGSVIARDRAAIAAASQALRFAAGNFHMNDKPTGAVVGHQPFGGGRARAPTTRPGRCRT